MARQANLKVAQEVHLLRTTAYFPRCLLQLPTPTFGQSLHQTTTPTLASIRQPGSYLLLLTISALLISAFLRTSIALLPQMLATRLAAQMITKRAAKKMFVLVLPMTRLPQHTRQSLLRRRRCQCCLLWVSVSRLHASCVLPRLFSKRDGVQGAQKRKIYHN